MQRLLTALAVGLAWVAFGSPASAVTLKSVRIDSTPPGASVYLDKIGGKPLGVTPIRRAKVPYGFHEIIFVLEGHETQKIPVNVGRSTRRVRAELPLLAKVMVSAGSASARGAQVVIDGHGRGNVPWTGFVKPGRHRIEVRREGYATFGDWVELVAGQILTLPAVLAEAQAKGTLFITADLPVASVFVDARRVGETPVLLEVPEGKAVVEVHGPDGLIWRKTVEIKAGDKTIVEAALLPETGPSGTALILSNVAGTSVWVDGVKTGTAPVTLRRLAVGTHIVEGKADGYSPEQTTVRVNQDEQTVVKLELSPSQAEYGRISVRAAVPGAEVFVDGGGQGPAPVEMDKVPLGPHAIIVRAKGHADFEAACDVKRNQTCSVMATQTALARIKVIANAPNARLFIDGNEIGPVPYEGSLSAEVHRLRVEAPFHIAKEEKLEFQASTDVRELSFNLSSDGTSPQEISERKQQINQARMSRYEGASHLSGVPPAPGKNRIHVSLGVPYLLEGGGTVGIVEHVAVTVRFRLLERNKSIGSADIILGSHVGWRPIKPVSLGAKIEGWAGSNMERVGTAASVGGTVKGMATLHFGERAQFSLTLSGEVFHDSWSATEDDYIVERDGTNDAKQGGGRLMVGGQLLLWAKEKVAIWGSLDWKAVGPARYMFQQAYFGALDFDPEIYLHVGVEFAF